VAISVFEKPFEIGWTICLRIAVPRGERLVQSIAEGVVGVEADTLDAWPFVDAVLKDPACSSEAASCPVDDAEPEICAGVAGERNPAWLEMGAEFPALFDEVDVQLLSVVGG
jgi:hypothetical protein